MKKAGEDELDGMVTIFQVGSSPAHTRLPPLALSRGRLRLLGYFMCRIDVICCLTPPCSPCVANQQLRRELCPACPATGLSLQRWQSCWLQAWLQAFPCTTCVRLRCLHLPPRMSPRVRTTRFRALTLSTCCLLLLRLPRARRACTPADAAAAVGGDRAAGGEARQRDLGEDAAGGRRQLGHSSGAGLCASVQACDAGAG